jgi:hypothetical protein
MARRTQKPRSVTWPVRSLALASRHLQAAEQAIAHVVEKSPVPIAVTGHRTVLDAQEACKSALNLFAPAHRLRDQVETIHRCRYCHALVWSSGRVRHLYEHHVACATESEAARHYKLPEPSAYLEDE